jgi:hypothetical protein
VEGQIQQVRDVLGDQAASVQDPSAVTGEQDLAAAVGARRHLGEVVQHLDWTVSLLEGHRRRVLEVRSLDASAAARSR